MHALRRLLLYHHRAKDWDIVWITMNAELERGDKGEGRRENVTKKQVMEGISCRALRLSARPSTVISVPAQEQYNAFHDFTVTDIGEPILVA